MRLAVRNQNLTGSCSVWINARARR